MQLATVSGVPVNAQKLIYKGKQISADVESTLIQVIIRHEHNFPGIQRDKTIADKLMYTTPQ